MKSKLKEMKGEKKELSDLPKDMMIEILTFCNIKDLGEYATVSKEFNTISSSDYVWKDIFKRQGENTTDTLGYKARLKKQYDERYEYQTIVKETELPKINVLLLGNGVDHSEVSLKRYVIKGVLAEKGQELPINLDSANTKMGPKQQEIYYQDTASQERYMQMQLKGYIRSCKVAIILPKDIENLQIISRELKRQEYEGSTLCFSNNKGILDCANKLKYNAIEYKGETPETQDINALNKTIVKIAGPESVKDFEKIQSNTKTKKDGGCSIM